MPVSGVRPRESHVPQQEEQEPIGTSCEAAAGSRRRLPAFSLHA